MVELVVYENTDAVSSISETSSGKSFMEPSTLGPPMESSPHRLLEPDPDENDMALVAGLLVLRDKF